MAYHQNQISFIYTFYFKHELPAPVLGLVAIKIYTYHLVYLFIMGKERNDRNNFASIMWSATFWVGMMATQVKWNS